MCYSKEVQAVTGSTVLLFSLGSYIVYSAKYKNMQEKWLLPFLKNVTLFFIMVGGHQLLESLALATNSQFISKTGLIMSVSSTYFALRSLEVILNRNLRSKIMLFFIATFAFYLYFLAGGMSFFAYSFYVKHYPVFLWIFLFMIFFIYWHVCALSGIRFLKDDVSKKVIVFYLFAIMDIAFLLSLAYAAWGYSKYSVSMCTGLPSIWCTFSVVQVFFLPLLLGAIPKMLHVPTQKTKQSIKETAICIAISLVLLWLDLWLLPPLFGCLGLKFLFK